MGYLGEKISSVAELVLKRQLAEDEELEIYKIADALGMGNVQTFIHELLVFKVHEDTMKRHVKELASFEERMNERFSEMGALANRIDETLKASIEKILGDGAERIGADMGKSIAENAKETLGARDDYQFLRGQLCTVCLTGVIAAVAYWLGAVSADGNYTGPFGILFTLPAGWWIFFSWSLCTFMWAYDHWEKVKSSSYYKAVLALHCFVTLILLASLL